MSEKCLLSLVCTFGASKLPLEPEASKETSVPALGLLAEVLAEARSWVLRDCVGFTPSPKPSPSARCLRLLAQRPRNRRSSGTRSELRALPTVGAGVTLGHRLEAHKGNQLNAGGARSLVWTWELVLSPLGTKKIMKARSSAKAQAGLSQFPRQQQQRVGAAGRAASSTSHRAWL